MGPVLLRLALVLLLSTLPATSFARADADADDVILPVLVGDTMVTEQDVEAALRLRQGSFAHLAPDERRQRAIELLVAERGLRSDYLSGGLRLPPAISLSMDSARWQVLRDMYSSAAFEPPSIGDAEIAAYVESARHEFDGRHTYLFHRILIQASDRTETAAAVAALGAAGTGTALAAIDRTIARINRAGVIARHDLRWARSEELDEPLRLRLQRLDAEGGVTDVLVMEDRTDIVLLREARESPVDPEDVRDQIRDRIVARALLEHRAERLAALAAPILERSAALADADIDAPEAPLSVPEEEIDATTAVVDSGVVEDVEEPAPPERTAARAVIGDEPIVAAATPGIVPLRLRLLAVGLLGMSMPLVFAAWSLWLRTLLRQREKLLALRPLATTETLSFAIAVSAGLMLVILVAAIWSLGARPEELPMLRSAALVVGGTILGAGAAWLWWRSALAAETALAERMREKYPTNPALAEQSALFGVRSLDRLQILTAAVFSFAIAARVAAG